tara:strand:- start:3336 stop:3647 length:312 start_codon:yes stop_codon:yes gene_type:complete
MKKIIPLFILLYSCVNTGSSLKDSPGIKNVQKDQCEIVAFFSSNENKQIVKCNSGYSFKMPKEEIDSKSCKLERYRVNFGGSYTIKESLKCKDFENENIITIY